MFSSSKAVRSRVKNRWPASSLSPSPGSPMELLASLEQGGLSSTSNDRVWQSALPIKREKKKKAWPSLKTQLKLRSISAPFKPGKLTRPEEHDEEETADSTRVFHQL